MLPTTFLSVFFFSFVIAIGAVVFPGPVSTSIVSQSPRRGWLTGPLVATGHISLELIMVILLTLGLGVGLANPTVQIVISILGGALLAWMGLAMIRDTWQRKIKLPSREVGDVAMNTKQLIGLGMIATISNPFWYAWWVTVAAGYLYQAKEVGLVLVLAFYLGHITVDYAWDTILSTIIGNGSRWMTDKVYRLLIYACGAFFLYMAWVFLIQGISRLI
ncbi:MAG: LysE family transporter [Anaerolineales bacterium]|nr:LysE family transporter [Anaerolineales bacterium]